MAQAGPGVLFNRTRLTRGVVKLLNAFYVLDLCNILFARFKAPVFYYVLVLGCIYLFSIPDFYLKLCVFNWENYP